MNKPHQQTNIPRPPLWKLLFEVRALGELAAYIATIPLHTLFPKGDGHNVMVMPGLGAGDFTTLPLRKFLQRLGYNAHGWGLGNNTGDHYRVIDEMPAMVERLYAEGGHEKISIIGWSLGGIYAREVARRVPHSVRQVITLGSPFSGIYEPNNARWLYKQLNGSLPEETDPELTKDILIPPPVPVTAVYSKGDGVVPWQYCMERQASAPNVQNVCVPASHSGFGHNPIALWCVADRLMRVQNQQQPFDWVESLEALLNN